MTPIEDCPKCGAPLQVPENEVGTRVECPECGHRFLARIIREEPSREVRSREREPASRRICPKCGGQVRPGDTVCPECEAPLGRFRERDRAEVGSKKLVAGLCGILIGSLGIHKFILGFSTAGIIMLLVTVLTCGIGGMAMWVIGLIEGIIYLTRSDEEFYRLYMVEKKEWF